MSVIWDMYVHTYPYGYEWNEMDNEETTYGPSRARTTSNWESFAVRLDHGWEDYSSNKHKMWYPPIWSCIADSYRM